MPPGIASVGRSFTSEVTAPTLPVTSKIASRATTSSASPSSLVKKSGIWLACSMK